MAQKVTEAVYAVGLEEHVVGMHVVWVARWHASQGANYFDTIRHSFQLGTCSWWAHLWDQLPTRLPALTADSVKQMRTTGRTLLSSVDLAHSKQNSRHGLQARRRRLCLDPAFGT